MSKCQTERQSNWSAIDTPFSAAVTSAVRSPNAATNVGSHHAALLCALWTAPCASFEPAEWETISATAIPTELPAFLSAHDAAYRVSQYKTDGVSFRAANQYADRSAHHCAVHAACV